MNSSEEFQEITILEQNLQNLLFQKQAFQMELNETESALNELEGADDEVYKIAGQILIKSNKENLKKELLEKKKLIELRISSIEKQEKFFSEKISKISSKKAKNPSK